MANFNNPRYITRGISTTIPENVQLALWSAIDKLVASGTSVDYLQVFKLETITVGNVQHLKVIHTQEVPEYKETYLVEDFNLALDCKVFVIDDTTHSTMLLASEY